VDEVDVKGKGSVWLWPKRGSPGFEAKVGSADEENSGIGDGAEVKSFGGRKPSDEVASANRAKSDGESNSASSTAIRLVFSTVISGKEGGWGVARSEDDLGGSGCAKPSFLWCDPPIADGGETGENSIAIFLPGPGQVDEDESGVTRGEEAAIPAKTVLFCC
jgi:hypothetical protein